MVSVPLALPAVVGLKPTESAQSDVGAIEAPQPLEIRTKGGVTTRLVTVSGVELAFCAVSDCAEACEPTSTSPKASTPGAMVTEPAGMPAPVSEAVNEPPVMLPETVSCPKAEPVAVGTK